MDKFLQRDLWSKYNFFRCGVPRKACFYIICLVFLSANTMNAIADDYDYYGVNSLPLDSKYRLDKRIESYKKASRVYYKIADKEAFHAFHSLGIKHHRHRSYVLGEVERLKLRILMDDVTSLTDKIKHCEVERTFEQFLRVFERFFGVTTICTYAYYPYAEEMSNLIAWLMRLKADVWRLDQRWLKAVREPYVKVSVTDSFKKKSIENDKKITKNLVELANKYHIIFHSLAEGIRMDRMPLKLINRPIYYRMLSHTDIVTKKEKPQFLVNYHNFLIFSDTLEYLDKELGKRIWMREDWFFLLARFTKKYPLPYLSHKPEPPVSNIFDIGITMRNNMSEVFEHFGYQDHDLSTHIANLIHLSIDEIEDYMRKKWYVVDDRKEFHITNMISTAEPLHSHVEDALDDAAHEIRGEQRPKLTSDKEAYGRLVYFTIDTKNDALYNAFVIEKTNANGSGEKKYSFEVARKTRLVFQIINAEAQATLSYLLKNELEIIEQGNVMIDLNGKSEVNTVEALLSPGRYELSFSSQRMANYLVLIRVPEEKKDDGIFPFKNVETADQKLNYDSTKVPHNPWLRKMHHLPTWAKYSGFFAWREKPDDDPSKAKMFYIKNYGYDKDY